MPDSVLTPAPVKTTGRRAEANSAPRRAIGSSVTAADASGAFVVASAASPAWDVGGLFATRGAPGGPTSVAGSRPASPSGGRRAGGIRCGGRRRRAPRAPLDLADPRVEVTRQLGVTVVAIRGERAQ